MVPRPTDNVLIQSRIVLRVGVIQTVFIGIYVRKVKEKNANVFRELERDREVPGRNKRRFLEQLQPPIKPWLTDAAVYSHNSNITVIIQIYRREYVFVRRGWF